MKLKSIFIGSVLAATCLCLQAQAQNAGIEMPGVTIYGNNTGITVPNGEIYGPVTHVTELIGLDIWNFQKQKLGEIRAITVDLQNARLVLVFISSGGGIITPVPPTVLSHSVNLRSEIGRLNISKAGFDAAPKIRMSDVAVYSHPERAAAVYRYFGQEPWFAYSGQKNGRPLLGYVQTTDAIQKMEIRNLQGRYMGRVGSLVMSLPKGRILQMVDTTAAMGGTGHHILQPGTLRYNGRHDGLLLNQTFAELKDKPHVIWTNERAESFVQEVNASQNAQARSAGIMTGRLPAPFLSAQPRIEVRKAVPAR